MLNFFDLYIVVPEVDTPQPPANQNEEVPNAPAAIDHVIAASANPDISLNTNEPQSQLVQPSQEQPQEQPAQDPMDNTNDIVMADNHLIDSSDSEHEDEEKKRKRLLKKKEEREKEDKEDESDVNRTPKKSNKRFLSTMS